MFLFPPNPYFEGLTPIAMVLRGGAFQGSLDLVRWSPHNGISVLMGRGGENRAPSLSHKEGMWAHSKMAASKPGRGPSPGTRLPAPGPRPSQLQICEADGLGSMPPHPQYFVVIAQAE